jgi:hypothetical protein
VSSPAADAKNFPRGTPASRLDAVNHMVQDLLFFSSSAPPYFADIDAAAPGRVR